MLYDSLSEENEFVHISTHSLVLNIPLSYFRSRCNTILYRYDVFERRSLHESMPTSVPVNRGGRVPDAKHVSVFFYPNESFY